MREDVYSDGRMIGFVEKCSNGDRGWSATATFTRERRGVGIFTGPDDAACRKRAIATLSNLYLAKRDEEMDEETLEVGPARKSDDDVFDW